MVGAFSGTSADSRWSWNASNAYPKKFQSSLRAPNRVVPVWWLGSRVK